MKLYVLLFIALFCLFCGCRTNSTPAANSFQQTSLTVSAAVSLKDAFSEIGAIYKNRTGNNIDFNFGASGALQKQIETGAPVDVFASAGEKQMNDIAAENLIDSDSHRDFARNTLVLIAPKNQPNTATDFKNILTSANVKKIAVGNPKTVPAGQYADEVFEKLNLKKDLQQKLILAEDVRQVLDYVAHGEADFGIVYQTDALTAKEKIDVVATFPEETHSPILYPIAIIKDSKQKAAAQEFINLILSAEGQNILKKYGFIGVAEK